MKKIFLSFILILCVAVLSSCRGISDNNKAIENEVTTMETDTVVSEDTSGSVETEETTEPKNMNEEDTTEPIIEDTEETEETAPSESQPEDLPEFPYVEDPWSMGSFSEDDMEIENEHTEADADKENAPGDDTTASTEETTEEDAKVDEDYVEDPWSGGEF